MIDQEVLRMLELMLIISLGLLLTMGSKLTGKVGHFFRENQKSIEQRKKGTGES